MPTYNTPRKPKPAARPKYAAKPTPRHRSAVGSQLPSARSRQQRRRGGTYLKRSQGFGGRRRGRGLGQNNDPRRVYALIIVGCALLLFAASILWYANRGVDITLNGQTVSVRIHSSIKRVIEEKELDPTPGNLLAVDDKVLEKGKGTACTVTLDGKRVKNSKLETTQLEGGEELVIEDGEDVYEKHSIQATSIQPELVIEGSGPVGYVETWGEAGRTEIWTGEQTGKTVDRGVVKQPVTCVVKCVGLNPGGEGKYIALTFDESPSARTEDILGILKEKDAKATFFVSGDKVAGNPGAVRAIVESGNELGTNAFSDESLTELSAADLREQISSSFDAVEQVTGSRIGLLRPPYGEFSAQNWADGMDLVSAVVSWDADSGDWLLEGAQSVVDNVVGSAVNGSIVLLTDGDATADQAVEALPQIIDKLQADGFELVTLSELIALDEDLSEKLSLGAPGMPKGAALPKVPEDSEEGAEGEAAAE